MWNTFSNLAEKAKAAAQDLEGQLNESVGAQEQSGSKSGVGGTAAMALPAAAPHMAQAATTTSSSSLPTSTASASSQPLAMNLSMNMNNNTSSNITSLAVVDDDDDDPWADDFDVDDGAFATKPTTTPTKPIAKPIPSAGPVPAPAPVPATAPGPPKKMETKAEILATPSPAAAVVAAPTEPTIRNEPNQQDVSVPWTPEPAPTPIEAIPPIGAAADDDPNAPEKVVLKVVDHAIPEPEPQIIDNDPVDDDQGSGWQDADDDLDLGDDDDDLDLDIAENDDNAAGVTAELTADGPATTEAATEETAAEEPVAPQEPVTEQQPEPSPSPPPPPAKPESVVRQPEAPVSPVQEPEAPTTAVESAPMEEPVIPDNDATLSLPVDTEAPPAVVEQETVKADEVVESSPAAEVEQVPEPIPSAEEAPEPVPTVPVETEPAPDLQSAAPHNDTNDTDEVSEAVEANDAEPPKEAEAPIAPPTAAAVVQNNAEHEAMVATLHEQIASLQERLGQREEQLFQKTEQMTTMESMFEAKKDELVQAIAATKEEAKRRIAKAKERVEAADAQMQAMAASQGGSAEQVAKQAEIISELRSEGEKLAHKQSAMEQAVRTAKGEARELRQALEDEQDAKDQALMKTQSLQEDLSETKGLLSAARQGESQAVKLDQELQSAREDLERKSSAILSLEQRVKEYKKQTRELQNDLDAARKGAVLDTEREQKKLRQEHDHTLSDMELKLRTGEREAAVREDALRHEVEELRKRWQDAVRRADALSMDVQSSSAPLLRQLESLERQGRARASAWAELETKLRAELEETVVQVEQLSKERTEWKTKWSRLERTTKDDTDELKRIRIELEDKTIKMKKTEDKLNELETESARKKEEWAEIERLANEGVSRVRSEMTQTVVEAEERHRSQLDSLEADLRQERSKRSQLEQQVQEMLDRSSHHGSSSMPKGNGAAAFAGAPMEARPKKLRKSQKQSDILEGALNGLGDNGDDDFDDNSFADSDDELFSEAANGEEGVQNSFAAMEQFTSKLKVAKLELETLRKSLKVSEKNRNALVEELTESRVAKDKLPLFEARVKELTIENHQQAQEIQALQEDVADVRNLYRSQLNALLVEKATALEANGSVAKEEDDPANAPQTTDASV